MGAPDAKARTSFSGPPSLRGGCVESEMGQGEILPSRPTYYLADAGNKGLEGGRLLVPSAPPTWSSILLWVVGGEVILALGESSSGGTEGHREGPFKRCFSSYVPKGWGIEMGRAHLWSWTQELRASPLGPSGQGLLPGRRAGFPFPAFVCLSASLVPHVLLSFTLQTVHILQVLGQPPQEAPGPGSPC